MQRGSHIGVGAQHLAGEHQQVVELEPAFVGPQAAPNPAPSMRSSRPAVAGSRRRTGRGHPLQPWSCSSWQDAFSSGEIGPILLLPIG